MSKNEYVKGHRQRVKNKFLKTKFDNWQDYEILEFALFFVIPQKDTKEIAKILIKKFGSLKELLNADYDELNKIFKDIKGLLAFPYVLESHFESFGFVQLEFQLLTF